VSRFLEIGTEIGALVQEKNAAYGSSFAKCGDFMRLLYPNGIEASQMEDALLLVRIFDKLQRIATDRDALGESPYRDIAGYGILGASLHEQRRGHVGTGDVSVLPESRLREPGREEGTLLRRRMQAVRVPRGGPAKKRKTI